MTFLILTGKFGMGHYSAARSLAQQIEESYPQSQVQVVDFLEYALPELSGAIYKGFELLVNRGTGFYNRVYHITDNGGAGNRPFFQRYLLGKMGELIFHTKPTVILSTLPLCSQLVSCYKRRYSDSLPLVTCITDVTSHSEWINDFTDYYLVASPSVRRELVAKGVKGEQICVGGIPVKREFGSVHPAEPSPGRHLLIMGGGLGLLPKSMDFYQQLDKLPGVKTTIITGNNRPLYEQLQGRFSSIQVVGYTDKVYEYMGCADVILTKPGGITLFETIRSELPMLVIRPYLPQEIANGSFITENQIGRVMDCSLEESPDRSIEEIRAMLCDGAALERYRENIRRFQGQLYPDAVSWMLHSILRDWRTGSRFRMQIA